MYRQSIRKSLTFIVLFILCSDNLLAAVHEDLQYHPYRVAVEEDESLLQALNRATPIRQDGKLFHAHTRWTATWRAQWQKGTNNHCAIKDLEVDLITVMQLPRLAQASPGQHRTFNQYSKHLVTHELGHHDIGRQAAFAIERFLLSGPSAKDCTSLQNKIDKIVAEIIQLHEQKDKAYDRTTRHGETQGAYLQDQN